MSRDQDFVTLGHGGGGLLTQRLIREHLVRLLPAGEAILNDAAALEVPGARLAFTTDSFVVTPRFFPGGDIGKLAVFGTVNDVAMRGGVPQWLSLSLVLEEGLPVAEVERIVASIQAACEQAQVQIVTGDTKVVERGAADGVYINTCGLGVIPDGINLAADQARPGDAVLVNGTIAEHGMAVLLAREELGISGDLVSDSAPVHRATRALIEELGPDVHVLRDPTRGGLAAVANEIAQASEVQIELDERSLPCREVVQGACELLGLDPLLVPSEGRFVAFVADQAKQRGLEVLQSQPGGAEAAIIGRVTEDTGGRVVLGTSAGTRRLVDLPSGEVLPRIC